MSTPNIAVYPRHSDWIAHLEADTRIWGCGRDPWEAVTDMLAAHKSVEEIGVRLYRNQRDWENSK